jgi:hypothetical protein
MAPRDHDIFTARGITPPWKKGGHVARAEGFERYEGADWKARRAVAAEHAPFGWEHSPDPEQSRHGWIMWLAGAFSRDGWVMPRHAVMPGHEDTDWRWAPLAQLRPDAPLASPPLWHHHWFDLEGWGERWAHEHKVCEPAPPGHLKAIAHPDGAYLPTGHLHRPRASSFTQRTGGTTTTDTASTCTRPETRLCAWARTLWRWNAVGAVPMTSL